MCNYTKQDFCKDISISIIKDLHVGLVSKRRSLMMVSHLFCDGHDGKVKDQCCDL